MASEAMDLISDHDSDQEDRSQEVSEVDDESQEEEDSDTDEEEGPAEACIVHERHPLLRGWETRKQQQQHPLEPEESKERECTER